MMLADVASIAAADTSTHLNTRRNPQTSFAAASAVGREVV
jgi:hypothetical protein